jgi:mannose-1-phosphate guanylyltransferase/mannose-6-phosphate isomerase
LAFKIGYEGGLAAESLGMSQLIPVILCGGAGTRLWPESRDHFPKQFLSIDGKQSIFRATLDRIMAVGADLRPIVITNEALRFLVLEELDRAGIKGDILLEPERRDTCAAIAAATSFAMTRDSDCVIALFPSDHHIGKPDAFVSAIAEAAAVAEQGYIVTLGIKPSEPSTGYGYIRPGPRLNQTSQALRAEKFVEKPDLSTAERYIAEGYVWNGGMFVGRADTLKSELALRQPAIVAAVATSVRDAKADGAFLRLDKSAFAASPQISFDRAVMESTDRAVVLPVDLGWSDIGAWDAVWAASRHDQSGNALGGDVVTIDTSNSLLRSDRALLAVIGMDNVVVVETGDAVLVAPMARAQEVRELVERLRRDKRREASEHRRVLRPWGQYEGKDAGERYQVKRITVKPGARLSLQKHYHRSEHWVVVRGTAKVTIEDKVQIVHENQSTYIPVGAVHRLENPGLIPLELIEVQVGSYLEEDDIIRVSDDYGR